MAKPASGASINNSDAQGLSTSLANVWAFLEGSGTTSADSKGGDTATLASSSYWSTDANGPIISIATASNTAITLASTVSLTASTDWSIAFRAKLNAANNQGMVA